MSAKSGAVSGVGLGLRWEFAEELLERRPSEIDFLEIAPDNYLGRGGAARRTIERAAARYPVLSHGLAMSLGGSDPLDERYLADLRAFFGDFASPWHSDHACMTSDAGRVLHDLLPLPLTRDSANHLAERIMRAQDRLGVPMAIENVSFYARVGKSELSEPAFMRLVCERAQCGLLFDVNNAVVNATNFDLPIEEWLDQALLGRVVQIHVAGHEWFDVDEGELVPYGAMRPEGAPREGIDRLIVDTHGANAQGSVLALLERTLRITGAVPIVIERDQNIPPLAELLAEVDRVRAVATRALRAHAAERAP